MPSFLVKRIAEPNFQDESLEEIVERLSKTSNRNFDALKNLLYGNVDFVNVNSGGLLQTWQDSNEDNVDEDYDMVMDLYMPSETSRIHRVILRLRLKEFRAYSRAASTEPELATSTADGGSVEQTTNNETIAVSETSGASSETSSSTDDVSVETGIYKVETGPSVDSTVGAGEHNHGLTDHTHQNEDNEPSGSDIEDHSHSLHPHGHEIEVEGHEHNIEHTHTVSFEDTHSHWVEVGEHSHSFVVPEHNHDLIQGIYVEPFPTDPGVTIEINGTDRTSELGGPFHISEPSLDITEWVVIGQWNTVKFGCAAGKLLRLQATMFIQAFIAPVDRLDPEER